MAWIRLRFLKQRGSGTVGGALWLLVGNPDVSTEICLLGEEVIWSMINFVIFVGVVAGIAIAVLEIRRDNKRKGSR